MRLRHMHIKFAVWQKESYFERGTVLLNLVFT